ncbi:hypothetical protein RSPO_c00344 [Ralstonia solanacearum Po82]|uniref:Uncharacterized protein n=1 Tax=Ralstonia solanacearum (strain Po82) TaxID=1031711 RepID=F6G6V3_RALS8|nr:hypothetical protein RSPO_c00344 [Ralstonia solanacearum Po82]
MFSLLRLQTKKRALARGGTPFTAVVPARARATPAGKIRSWPTGSPP